MDRAELDKRFDYHAPTELKIPHHESVRRWCKALGSLFLELPESREKALALTALEEASFWANAAIARND